MMEDYRAYLIKQVFSIIELRGPISRESIRHYIRDNYNVTLPQSAINACLKTLLNDQRITKSQDGLFKVK